MSSCISSPWCTCADASDYLREIVVMCYLACWFRSGAVLKFDQFCHSCFLPSSNLFPRKNTYAKVIDLRNVVLWTIGFIANRYRIPPDQCSLCPLLAKSITKKICQACSAIGLLTHCTLFHMNHVMSKCNFRKYSLRIVKIGVWI